jgi:hypothetical protein
MGPCPWDDYTPGTVSFCEARLCASIVEPANAWSNVAFLLVGIALFWRSIAKGRASSPLILFGVTGVLVSAGSFLFHVTATFWGEFLDLAAMFLISSLMLTLDFRHLLGFSTRRSIGTYAALSLGSMLAVWLVRPIGIGLFITHITVWSFLVIGLMVRRPGYRTWQLPTLMTLFLVGFGIWNLDIHRIACDPNNHVFNGHVVWHLTCATSLFLYYMHQERLEDRATAARAAPRMAQEAAPLLL